MAAARARIGEDFSRLSLPIPVDIEGQPIHCPLYLNLEMKSDNIPFDKFAAGPLDSAQTMFVDGGAGDSKEDAAAFASVWTSPDQMRRLDQATTVTMVDDNADNWIKVARSAFDFDKLMLSPKSASARRPCSSGVGDEVGVREGLLRRFRQEKPVAAERREQQCSGDGLDPAGLRRRGRGAAGSSTRWRT